MSSGGHGPGKIRVILTTLVVVFIIALIIFWLVTGGFSAAWRAGQSFTNPINFFFGNGTTTGILIRLPWQPASSTRGPDISNYVKQADAQNEAANQSSPQQNRYAQLHGFGNPSPHAGEITITDNNATAQNPQNEYVGVTASAGNADAVDVSGWYLQSAVSGLSAPLPQAASPFITGVVNNVGPVTLAPGASAIITTGTTPVGTSFQENICSGYLEQLQKFTPELSNTCPDPSAALPETADNMRTYGTSCFDYVTNLPRCYFPQNVPANLSNTCRTFITNNLSYNGCVQMYRGTASFSIPSWRLYLNMRAELWNNTHDIIDLLDAQGRTVDVLTY